MDPRSLGLALLIVGSFVVLIGAAAYLGLLGWFGRLPGDIRIDSGNVKVYAPMVSMLVISLSLTLCLALIRRLF
jgi:hypothetical protein